MALSFVAASDAETSPGCDLFHWWLFHSVAVSPGCPGRFTEAWPYSSKAAGLNLSTWSFADSMPFLNLSQDLPATHQISVISAYPSRNSRSQCARQELLETLQTTYNRNPVSPGTRVSRQLQSWSDKPAIQTSPLDRKDPNGFHGGTRSITPLLISPHFSKIIIRGANLGVQYRAITSTEVFLQLPTGARAGYLML